MALSLAQMRAVDAVARHGQISRAAQSLGVSQPLISNQIQAFEAAWQIRIFDRDGYRITVAPGAEALMGRIRLAVDLLAEVESALTAQSADEARQLALGFSAHRLVMPALTEFVRLFPNVTLSTLGAPTMDLLAALKRGEIHLASVSLHAPEPGFHAVELARRPLVVYGQRGHALLQGDPVALSALHDQPMVLWNLQSGSRRRFDALCSAAGVAPRVTLEVDTQDVAYAAVAAGIGLGTAIEGEVLPDAYIDVVPLVAPGAEIGQFLLCLKGAEIRHQVAAFIEIARAMTPGADYGI
ncbi:MULTISPECIES: LysR family transcriptional regulator [Alphaproteobacteria]|uniref:Transcriptional regulator n=2 Tax=Alphaproteobacteria TaxID=28211 RepID=A0A512HH55_9HYPH|nr:MULTISPECIES: LysR family transcriptional regulator [Alphaproteobacteria]GEO84720.1 transcriptional regulator [Ciceribacter naphthalenivorans]GLR20659.1 transcriptional regulator [Ciceribacter naphthalenivorans]GLT03515.1 transcriptional regulator [Sphingomonas psychrolutea]